MKADEFCRLFIQFANKLSESEECCEEIEPEPSLPSEALLNLLISTINEKLNTHHTGLSMHRARDEYDDDVEFVVLACERPSYNDALNRKICFSREEMRVCEGLFDCLHSNGQLHKNEAVSLLHEEADAQLTRKVINKLLLEKCIVEDEATGNLRLGLRAEIGLQGYFQDRYDSPLCVLCNRIIFVKQRAFHCQTCDGYLHRQCQRRYDLLPEKPGKKSSYSEEIRKKTCVMTSRSEIY
ncbi:hypothetical protein AB6A40_005780 [Gnathostoma spinigerum]|uniref:Phorbol-ester/DAG-type domain-containing protein n=1 Tax=Gnathostoma spinigerum TaxID=75299 RepID=A0ABD6EH73_9BILA